MAVVRLLARQRAVPDAARIAPGRAGCGAAHAEHARGPAPAREGRGARQVRRPGPARDRRPSTRLRCFAPSPTKRRARPRTPSWSMTTPEGAPASKHLGSAGPSTPTARPAATATPRSAPSSPPCPPRGGRARCSARLRRGLRRHRRRDRDDPVARGLPAVALGARGKDRPPFRRGPRAGRRQRDAGRGERIAGAARHRRRTLGTLRLDDQREAPAPAPGTRRPGLADANAPTPTLAARASFRTEHQTFIPIAASGRRSSRSTSTAFRSAMQSTSAHAANRLRDAIASMSPAVLGVPRPRRVRDPLLSWLGSRAHAVPARMKTTRSSPARIVIDDDGTPRSADYDDIYHARVGALAQARHVFLDGDALAARWRGRGRFVILETGFGLGNNFLATWAAWRADPDRCGQLHFISIEGRRRPAPSSVCSARPAAGAAGRRAGAAVAAAHLQPASARGRGRRRRTAARVRRGRCLAAAVGRGRRCVLPRWLCAGAQPGDVGRTAVQGDGAAGRAGASVATWSAARAVRDGLRGAGFGIENAAGSGGKRDITRGRFSPRFAPRRAAPRADRVTGPGAGPGAIGARRDGRRAAGGHRRRRPCRLGPARARRVRHSIARSSSAPTRWSWEGSGQCRGALPRCRSSQRRSARALSSRRRLRRSVLPCARARALRHGDAAAPAGLLRIELPWGPRLGWERLIHSQRLPADYVEALDRRRRQPPRRRPGRRPPGTSQAAWAGLYLLDSPGSWLAGRRRPGSSCASTAPWHRCVRIDARRGSFGDPASTRSISVMVPWRIVLAGGGRGVSLMMYWPVSPPARPDQCPWPRASSHRSETPRLPITGAGYVVPAVEGTVWFGASSACGTTPTRRSARHGISNRTPTAWRRLVGLRRSAARSIGSAAGSAFAGRATIACRSSAPCRPASPRAWPRASSTRASRRLRPAALRRAGARAVRVSRARLARHRVGGARRRRCWPQRSPGRRCRSRPTCSMPIDPARFLTRGFRRGEAARQRRRGELGFSRPVGPIAGSAGA